MPTRIGRNLKKAIDRESPAEVEGILSNRLSDGFNVKFNCSVSIGPILIGHDLWLFYAVRHATQMFARGTNVDLEKYPLVSDGERWSNNLNIVCQLAVFSTVQALRESIQWLSGADVRNTTNLLNDDAPDYIKKPSARASQRCEELIKILEPALQDALNSLDDSRHHVVPNKLKLHDLEHDLEVVESELVIASNPSQRRAAYTHLSSLPPGPLKPQELSQIMALIKRNGL